MTYVPRHIPARTNQGWAIAGLVVLLAAALIASVTVIHRNTYKDPTDPTWHAVGGAGTGTTAPAPAH